MLFVFLAILAIIYFLYKSREGFATKENKGKVIYNWFAQNNDPSYTNYKKEVPEPNIVEYEDILNLKQRGNFNLGQVIKLL
jgi:hypothetical protein